VGHLVLYLCEVFEPERARLADHICTALQLANFWQDVARDHEIGRIYLPEEDRSRFGVSEQDLKERRCTPAFVELLRFEVDRTRDLLYRGFPLLDVMPTEVRDDIELFLRGGLAILCKIEKCHYNVLRARPVLARWEKAALLTTALWRRVRASVW
jgi:phytoene/squalene synthetase